MSDFFEKMKEGFNKGVTAVSTGSKTVIEKTKVIMAVKNLENDKGRLAESLGNIVYDYYMDNDGADIPRSYIADKCKEIALCDEQIKINKNKIETMEEKDTVTR